MDILQSFVLAMGLGLLGFVEPCSVGSHLLFIKTLDQRSRRSRIIQTLSFVVTRSTLMAALGTMAALIGTQFQGIQEGLWVALGSLYVVLGLVYLSGGAGRIMALLNRGLPRVSPGAGGAGLGLVFGLNIPACAAPLLAVLLGDATARAASGSGVTYGASLLLVFGLALSAPLLVAVFTRTGRRGLDAIVRLTARMPRWTGAVLVALGLWSVWLGTTATA